jgi:hypothetical protein
MGWEEAKSRGVGPTWGAKSSPSVRTWWDFMVRVEVMMANACGGGPGPATCLISRFHLQFFSKWIGCSIVRLVVVDSLSDQRHRMTS